MVGETTKQERTPLLPLRHEQGDFFVCDIFDAAPKSDMASMTHPIFTLSTKPDTKPRRYDSPDGKAFVEITPSVSGMATVHDRDVLIYCISQVMAALKAGKQVHRTMRFKAYDLLVATNRPTAGTGYAALKAAFERLRGTTISTNIVTGGQEQLEIFGLIEKARIVRETRDGRMQDVEITLSDWVFNAIAGEEVLTLNRRYFQLRKPLERRLYELARKQCGTQAEWKIGLEKLQDRVGSTSSAKEFKRMVRAVCKADREHNHMPDYAFELMDEVLFIRPKPEFLDAYTDKDDGSQLQIPLLDLDTYEKAKQAAPGWDIHYLEQEWRSWATETPRSADAAFIGFCKKWFEKRGRP